MPSTKLISVLFIPPPKSVIKIIMITVGETHMNVKPSITIATYVTNSSMVYSRLHLLKLLVVVLDFNQF